VQVISLFSGIGGFELAAEWMGWQNIVSCEINPFGRKVLEYYWPNAYHHDDIKTLNYDTINNELTKRFGAEWRNDDIILTGGFPCQPYSLAGKRKGKDDERHLWPEMLRIIREVKPSWIVGENVFGIVNWNGGLVFHEVQTDLEAEGYEVQPYVLPAVSVNAPHRRDRVWFVAKNTKCDGFVFGEPNQRNGNDEEQPSEGGFNALGNADTGDEYGDAADTTSERFCGDSSREQSQSSTFGTRNRMGKWDAADTESRGNGRIRNESEEARSSEGNQPLGGVCGISSAADTDGIRLRRESNGIGKSRFANQEGEIGNWQNFPTQSPICTGNDEFSSRLDGITFSKWRNESIKAAGNAVVPQVVYQIFKAIEAYNKL
jgi:DNA (cytosine-5)-methyltransferase 1